ncbi:hypothetical protein D3C84_909130 [compost metagenome]
MRRGQGQHHHIDRPEKTADQLPARQRVQRRALLRTAEQQQQKQNRRADPENAQRRPQMPDLNPERPEQTGLHGKAHASQDDQRQQQQPQAWFGRRCNRDVG